MSDLISRARQGDHQAWESIVAQYGRAMYGMIRVRTHSDSEAEDVLQDTWLKVFQSLDRYRPEVAPFIAFLKQNALWKLLDHYKENAARREKLFSEFRSVTGEGDRDLAETIAGTPSDAGKSVFYSEEIYLELLRLTFSLPLPPHQLVAFGFCKLLEWKPEEMADKRSEHALSRLQDEFEEKYLDLTELPPDELSACFEPIRKKLCRQLGEVCESRARLLYQPLLERIVGPMLLREYYTVAPAENIRQWWFTVARRALSDISKRKLVIFSDLVAAERRRRAARKPDRTRKGGESNG